MEKGTQIANDVLKDGANVIKNDQGKTVGVVYVTTSNGKDLTSRNFMNKVSVAIGSPGTFEANENSDDSATNQDVTPASYEEKGFHGEPLSRLRHCGCPQGRKTWTELRMKL